MQIVDPIKCRYCQRTGVKCYGVHNGFRYYECTVCVYPRSHQPYRFRVKVNG